MKECSSRMMCLGLGLWDFIQEKSSALLSEIKKRGEARRRGDIHAAEPIAERSKIEQEVFRDKAGSFIKKAIGGMGLAGSADIKALQERVAALEEELRNRQGGNKADG